MPFLTVERNEAGQRLDRYLRKLLVGMPLGHIYKLLRNRKIRVNGKRSRAEYILSAGDKIIVHMDQAQFRRDVKRPRRQALSLDFRVVFEDEFLLAVSKPPGLPVHPGAGHPSNSLIDQVHAYLEVPDQPAAFRPSLAHRLDRDTSGLLLIGKTLEVTRALSRMLKQGQIIKYYLAFVRGIPKPRHGTWEFVVKRRDVPGTKKPTHPETGRRQGVGITAYRVTATRRLHLDQDSVQASLLLLRLLTGHTHQIRSHLLQAGYPLAGDRRYGEAGFNRLLKKRYNLHRQFLHAQRLELTHPATGKRHKWTDPYPHDLLPLARSLRLGVPSVN